MSIRLSRRSLTPAPDSFLTDLPQRLRQMLEGSVAFEPAAALGWTPAMEIVDRKDSLVVTAELPGLSPKDVNVNVADDVLTISGEKSEERKEGDEDSDYYLWERRYGSFNRSFTLPSAVDTDKIMAEFDNGVLTVRLPKSEKSRQKGRQIPVTGK